MIQRSLQQRSFPCRTTNHLVNTWVAGKCTAPCVRSSISMPVHCYSILRNYHECAKEGVRNVKKSLQRILFTASAHFQDIAIHILGDLLTTRRENKYIHTITKRCSKIVKVFLLKLISALSVARAFVDNLITSYGKPKTDNGSQFASHLMQ